MSHEIDTTPPGVDLDAERAVLGGAIMRPDQIDQIDDLITNRDFYAPRHALVWAALVDMRAARQSIDVFTLPDELTRRGDLHSAGGRDYITSLATAGAVGSAVERYAEIVHDNALRRRIYLAGGSIQQIAAADGYGTIDDLVERTAETLSDAATGSGTDDGGDLIGADDDELMAEIEHVRQHGPDKGVPTGFVDLDSLSGGLHPGQMVIVAARPAVGKSTLALDFARTITRSGRRVVLFSLEMSRREVQQRWLSAEARVGLHKIRSGNLTDQDCTALHQVRGALREVPLVVDATPGRTVSRIRAIARRQAAHGDLGAVIVDYLQLIEATGAGGRGRPENRQVEVSAMSRALKLLAKELGAPVVVVAQLNRGPEQRTDKKPLLSDLRESGSLEQDADMVILLHREDAYEPDSPRAGETDLIVAKNRSGPTATITVASQLHYSRFVDMSSEL